jgi:phenylalanyl-tRNA synthetase beta chain
LSLVIDKSINFNQIKTIAHKADKKLLKAVNVFDIYEGEKLSKHKKSYSVSFVLQDNEKTLHDKVIENLMNKLIKTFESELGAEIRR